MTAPATYLDNISYVVNGEQVEAGVANRTAQQLKQNTDYLKNTLDAISSKEYVLTTNRVLNSSTLVGTPVYYNTSLSQFDPAQAVSGKSTCVGIVYSKDSSTLGSVLLVGTGSVDITSVLQSGDTLTAGRYYLSETQAGKLTLTVPYHAVGTPAIQMSILVADGQGKVYVLPYEFKQGSQGPAGGPQGPQGAQGPQGPIGPQGPSITWETYRFAGQASPFDRWYASPITLSVGIVEFTPVSSTIYATPFLMPRTGILDRIGIYMLGASGQGGSVARVGIYTSTSYTNPYPSTLVLDAGTVATDSTGVKTINISQSLSSGQLFWLVVLFDTHVGICSVSGTDGNGSPGLLGFSTPNFTADTAPAFALKHSQAFGALPGSFPSSSPVFLSATDGVPVVICRCSS